MSIMIYKTKRRVELVIRRDANLSWNLPMNSNDFKIYKGLRNPIEFLIRDADRKPLDVTGKTITLVMYDQKTDTNLFTGIATSVNPTTGYCQFVITPDIIESWSPAVYRYTVVLTDATLEYPLYTDTNERFSGSFLLEQGVAFVPRDSETVTYDSLSLTSTYVSYLNLQTIRYSSPLPGSVPVGNYSAISTVVANFQNYTGSFEIQGSLDIGSPDEGSWFTIQTYNYDHHTAVENYTFTHNTQWIRFWLINSNDNNNNQPVLDADVGNVPTIVLRS
jgi:hypothetical protein